MPMSLNATVYDASPVRPRRLPPIMTAKNLSPHPPRWPAVRLKPRTHAFALLLLGAALGAFLVAVLGLCTAPRAPCGPAAAAANSRTTLPARSRGGFDGGGAAAAAAASDVVSRLRLWDDAATARRRLSVYVYELPAEFNSGLVELSRRRPPSIRDPFCDSNFYSSEMHVHRYLLRSAVRTRDASKADFFYVPIYATCNLLIHQPNDMVRNGAHFSRAMHLVINDFPYWNRSSGRDHVFLFAQGFGARLSGNWRRYRNAIFMVHNGEITAPEYTPHKDFTIPPQLRHYLLPAWLENPSGMPKVEKKYLAQFGGQIVKSTVKDHRGSNYSGGVRQYIQAHLADNPDYRITGVRSTTYLDDMKRSKFCLAPEGWHPWSPRPYYSILMGCIPVVISESQELAFEDLVDYDSFVVWIRPRDVAKLDAILRSFSDEEIERRRVAMSKYWRLFWYGRDGLGFQAILDELYRRKYASSLRRRYLR